MKGERMNYQDAFFKLVNEHGLEVLNDSFLVRSFLFDYVANSFNDAQLINAYYVLNRNKPLYKAIQGCALRESKDYIKSLILANPNFPVVQYIKSVEPLLLLLYPKEYVIFNGGPKTTGNSIKVIKGRNPVPAPIITNPVVNNNGGVVQKVIKPAINNNPAPNRKGMAVNNATYLTCSVNIRCKKLFISYSNTNKLVILNGADKDVTATTPVTINNGNINIVLKKKRQICKLKLPRRIYRSLNITFFGEELSIEGSSSSAFTADKVNINTEKGDTKVYLNSAVVSINQNEGFLDIKGKIEALNALLNYGHVTCHLDPSVQNNCNVQVNSGNIYICYPSCKIKPKMTHLFYKTNFVTGTYKINNRYIRFALSAPKGKISVYK